jgi:hypothetical protein
MYTEAIRVDAIAAVAARMPRPVFTARVLPVVMSVSLPFAMGRWTAQIAPARFDGAAHARPGTHFAKQGQHYTDSGHALREKARA